MDDADQLNKNIELSEKYCQEKGERLTKKRKLVLRILLSSQKAISAYELVDDCKKNYGEVISAMTVYRALEFLQSQGLAHRLELANKYVACSHIVCRHQHKPSQFLICNQCSRVEEVDVDVSMLKGLREVTNRTGFHLSDSPLELSGVCNKCI